MTGISILLIAVVVSLGLLIRKNRNITSLHKEMKPPRKITDKRNKQFYNEAVTKIESAVDSVKQEAEEMRVSDKYLDICKAGFYYLAVADNTKDQKEACKTYHFAGHQLRRVGHYNNAAIAYANAGVSGEEAARKKRKDDLSDAIKLQEFAIRSYARAKNCFAEVGESEKSEGVYIREQRARLYYSNMKREIAIGLKVWKYSCNFGTSLLQWGLWTLAAILVFSIIYQFFYDIGSILPSNSQFIWINWWSSVYFCFVTTSTLGYGDFYPNSLLAQVVMILNIIVGYLALGLGVGVIARIIKGR